MSGALDMSAIISSQPKSPERVKRFTRFTSDSDPKEILKHLVDTLTRLNVKFDIEEEYKVP